jgi:hypothetical protein
MDMGDEDELLRLSLTVTVKLKVPAAEGVPLIKPEEEERVTFPGSVPLADQVYGAVPPVAAS